MNNSAKVIVVPGHKVTLETSMTIRIYPPYSRSAYEHPLIQVDHICYLVITIVISMDVREVEKKHRSGPGNPAYSRRMLLKVVIMASMDAVWSSRKIGGLVANSASKVGNFFGFYTISNLRCH